MKTLNKTTLIGHLGADPEARETPAGLVVNLRLATAERGTDKTTGEIREKTEWRRIVLWRRLAEIARDSLKKGERVYLEGRLQTRKWTDASGQERWTTEILAHDRILLGGNPRPSGNPPSPTPSPTSHRFRTTPTPQSPATSATPDFADEDLPF